MKNPFKSAHSGFDAVIAKGHKIQGSLVLERGSTTIFDGTMSGDAITVHPDVESKSQSSAKTTLVINGTVDALKAIEVPNVTITGNVRCEVLTSSGVLAIKKGAVLNATLIRYSTLVVETGAIIHGTFEYYEKIGAPSSSDEQNP